MGVSQELEPPNRLPHSKNIYQESNIKVMIITVTPRVTVEVLSCTRLHARGNQCPTLTPVVVVLVVGGLASVYTKGLKPRGVRAGMAGITGEPEAKPGVI